jgi:Zn-dependent protease with chaperone function
VKNTFKVFLLFSILGTLTSASIAHAYVPLADTLLGEVIDKTLYVAGSSTIPMFRQYKRINDPKGVARVQRILQNIYSFSGHKFRYNNPTIRVITGIPSEANAYSLGPSIYITESMLSLLDDGELTAVIAHEISHSEYGHYLARMVYGIGSPILYLRNLVFSDIYSLTIGQSDAYMRKIMKEGQLKMVQEILDGASLQQEMQADCLAANWLARAHRLGWKLSPLDLNRATNSVMGMDMGTVGKIDGTLPPVIRYKAILTGQYIGSGCPL